MDTSSPPRGIDRQAVRLVTAFFVLSAIWGLAFNLTALPFFPVVVAGGVVTGLAGFWVRGATDEPEPAFAVTWRQVGLALSVAAGHFAVGHGLFALAARVVPALTETAAQVYQRSDTLPVWGQLLLGAGLTGAMEEVFWRGAFTTMVADRVRPYLPADLGDRRRGVMLVLVSTVGYTLFHVPTLKLALIAAAALGGLVWGSLLLVTRSVGVVIIAHVTWTAAMILVPPGL